MWYLLLLSLLYQSKASFLVFVILTLILVDVVLLFLVVSLRCGC